MRDLPLPVSLQLFDPLNRPASFLLPHLLFLRSFLCLLYVLFSRPLTKGQLVESEITSIAWNTDVPYILATGTVAGTVVVWDLKENKPWCMLRDPHRARLVTYTQAPFLFVYYV